MLHFGVLRFGALRFGLLLAIIFAGAASAQITEEIFGAIQFQFGPPGARSLGMGGAFAGLADDATAAYTNPAGLLWLTDPEIAVETSYSRYTTKAADTGSLSGTPTGVGLDIHDSIQISEWEDDAYRLGFLSYVHTWEDWSVAAYRHQLATYRGQIAGTEGFFLENFRGNRYRTVPLLAHLELDIVNWGISASYRLSDQLWVGFGASAYTFEIDGQSDRFDVIIVDDDGSFSPTFDPTDFSNESEIIDRHLQSGDDTSFGAHLGLLWRSNYWSVGAFYRPGPEFDFDYRMILGSSGLELAAARGFDAEGMQQALSGVAQFKVPDAAGIGATVRPNDHWVIAVQVDWIRYSDLQPNAVSSINGINNRDPLAGPTVGFRESFVVDDGWEGHLGAEYASWSTISWALRGGIWYETDHQMRYEPQGGSPSLGLAAQFPGGEDQWHITAGMGAAFFDGAVQLDFGIDYADRTTVASISTVVAF